MNDPYVETYTGKRVYFLRPEPEMFDIEDIAHALSNICRFTGHTQYFYSVAEHCVNTAIRVPSKYRLEGLLHDASEAYLTDVATPVKGQLGNYQEIEHNLMKAISKRFGFIYPLPPEVKEVDRRMLLTEAFWLMPSQGMDYEVKGTKYPMSPPYGWPPKRGKQEFLLKYKRLTQEAA